MKVKMRVLLRDFLRSRSFVTAYKQQISCASHHGYFCLPVSPGIVKYGPGRSTIDVLS